jgi:hypothetical protein
MPLDLPIHRLIQFDDEFAAFFRDPEQITQVEEVGCAYDATDLPAMYIRVSDTVADPRILLRNAEHSYLLMSYRRERRQWSASLAPDPKHVLEHLCRQFSSWREILPLVVAAGKREDSSETGSGKLDNPKYLEELMTEAYLANDPTGYVRRRLNVLLSPAQPTRGSKREQFV